MRPMALRRSWLFVGAADQAAILASYGSQADACIQEFEDFCVPEMREEARRIMPDVLSDWRVRNIVATVRINPLEDPDGLKDLEAAMRAGAEAILIPKANRRDQILLLEKYINELEKRFGRTEGTTAIIPNIEQAQGLVQVSDILSASSQIVGALVASEDMVLSLNAPRQKNSAILNHVRQNFHIACCSVGILLLICPIPLLMMKGLDGKQSWHRKSGCYQKAPSMPVIVKSSMIYSARKIARSRLQRRLLQSFEKLERQVMAKWCIIVQK